jgi:hypothetical protein
VLSASRLVDVVRDRISTNPEPLHVFWCRVDAESREAFCGALLNARQDVAIVPIVVRRAVLLDPNAILSDLNGLIADNRDSIEALTPQPGQPMVLVLLARSDFRLSQTGSLVRLPSWFPQLGDQEVFVRVRDLLFDADVLSFNAPEARSEDIASRLLELERALALRLDLVHEIHPRCQDSFWGAVTKYLDCDSSEPTRQSLLNGHKQHVQRVADPRGYRPTLKNKQSFLSQMIGLMQRSSPDQAFVLATKLSEALQIPKELAIRPSFIAILLRPTQPMESAVRVTHTVLTTAYGGYQFLNAAAHASDYPKVSAAFLHLNSRDIRLVLQEATMSLEGLAPPTV